MQNKEKNSFLSGLFKAVYQEYFGSQTGKIKPGEARAESVIHDFDVAQVTHVEKIGNHLVDMRLYSNRIARMLKKHCVNQAGDSGYERIYLSDFTTDCAKKAGLNFTIADCIQFTKAELGNTEPKKPKEPKGNLAVPPFYCYRACDVKRIQEALENGCGYDAPGSFAAWLSKQTPMHAYIMPGKRYDIGDINSYEYVKSVFSK